MPYRLSLAAVVAALAALALPAAAPAADVTVMTRNLYLGSDIINLAVAPDIPTLAQAAKKNLETVNVNNFPVRSKAIAAEVKKAKPDVIGLQEVVLWRRGPDGRQDNDISKLDAEQVLYDYLVIFTADLKRLGLSYKVARVTTELDIEGPHADGYDVRLTQRDAILVRKGKGAPKVVATRGGNFTAQFGVNTAIGRASVTRGYEAVDLKMGGSAFTFANLHTEAYDPAIDESQVKEFLRKGVPSRKRPTIVVGDINSDPKRSGTSDERGTERLPKAYKAMLAGGFRNEMPPRTTAGYEEDLRSPSLAKMDEWLDHVFVRPKMKLLRSSMTGTKQVNGLWPSDHRGIVATYRLPR